MGIGEQYELEKYGRIFERTYVIKEFKGKHRWLSNFFLSPFIHKGLKYKTVEHFYQANKPAIDVTFDIKTMDGSIVPMLQSEIIRKLDTPGKAKKMGRKVTLRSDWDYIKDDIMFLGLKLKFNQNNNLKYLLISTNNIVLQEGNTWGDKYWGIDINTGKGKNMLGFLLMKVREEING